MIIGSFAFCMALTWWVVHIGMTYKDAAVVPVTTCSMLLIAGLGLVVDQQHDECRITGVSILLGVLAGIGYAGRYARTKPER